MTELPLHPAIVHIPIGLAFVLPLVATAVTWAVWRRRGPRWAIGILFGLQLIVVAGGLAAMQTGEQDEERVERVVPERYIEQHADAGEAFVWGAGVAAALGLAALVLPGATMRWSMPLVVASTIVVLVLGWRAGERGGALVYEHGAAAAHVPAKSQPPAPPLVGSEPREEHEEE